MAQGGYTILYPPCYTVLYKQEGYKLQKVEQIVQKLCTFYRYTLFVKYIHIFYSLYQKRWQVNPLKKVATSWR